MRPATLLLAFLLTLARLAAPASAQIHGPHEERVKQVKELAKESDLDATKKIIPFLKDPHPFPRDAAFLALSELKDEKSIAWLATDGLNAGDADVRADIVEAIGVLGAKAAAPALVKMLEKSGDRNRALVAEVLGIVGSVGDSETLLKVARAGADPRVRAAALEAALRLDPAKAPEAVKLAAAVEGNRYELKVAAIRALLAADPAGAGLDAAVAAIAERRASWEKHESRSDVGPWQPAVAGMRGLSRLEGREKHADGLLLAIDALIPLLDHERGRVRHEVHAALIDLTGKADIPDDRAAWAGWWAVKREGFQPAPIAKRPPVPDPWAEKKRRKKDDEDASVASDAAASATSGATSVRFHGIPIFSDRLELIIDLSGSMQNSMPVKAEPGKGAEPQAKIDVSKGELSKTIASLPKEILFNVIFFGTDVKAWQAALVAASEPAKAEALEFVKKAEIMGRTNFWGALQRAISDPQADTVYFLTDGGMTTEGSYIDQRRITRQVLETARYSLIEIDCLLFGSESQQKAGSASRRWLEALASSTGGHFYIRPE